MPKKVMVFISRIQETELEVSDDFELTPEALRTQRGLIRELAKREREDTTVTSISISLIEQFDDEVVELPKPTGINERTALARQQAPATIEAISTLAARLRSLAVTPTQADTLRIAAKQDMQIIDANRNDPNVIEETWAEWTERATIFGLNAWISTASTSTPHLMVVSDDLMSQFLEESGDAQA